jgi:hypothetical protein
MFAAAMVSVAGLAACAGGGAQPAPASRDPAQAIASAVQHTEAVTSLTAKISEQSSRAPSATTATVQEQLKPTLLLSMRLNMTLGGTFPTTVILTPTAYYATVPDQALGRGKTWGKTAERPWGGLTSMAQTFEGQTGDPLAQIMLLRAVDGARNAGTQVVGGVRTAHYIGYYVPSRAIAALPPTLRDLLTPVPETLKNKVEFNIWIDPAQQIRKLSEVESVGAASVTTTIVFSGFNQPVHITVPPASQVASLPANG